MPVTDEEYIKALEAALIMAGVFGSDGWDQPCWKNGMDPERYPIAWRAIYNTRHVRTVEEIVEMVGESEDEKLERDHPWLKEAPIV